MKRTAIAISLIALLILCFILKPVPQKKPVPDASIQIAQTTTILRPSFIPAGMLRKYLAGTGLDGYASAFIEAEKETGIGADWLVAIAQHESGNGTNYYWKKWNNCFSWGITDSGPNQEAYFIRENLTKWQAIVYISKRFYSLYLSENGTYHSGNTLWDIGKYYASDDSWAQKVLYWHNRLEKFLPEDIRAKEWVMQTGILRGNLPAPKYYTSDYFSKPITKEELSIILYRINKNGGD